MNATTASTPAPSGALSSSRAAALPGSPLSEAYTRQAPGALDRITQALYWPTMAVIALAALYLVFMLYAAGLTSWALGVLLLFGTGFAVYLSKAGFAYRYLFPAWPGCCCSSRSRSPTRRRSASPTTRRPTC
ncbi:hypothetical protein ACFJIX_17365 [Roseateles sp. UC29_93]|uniref:hypothetical protein n=1 Tax=Roseateles sp. UC29_93 TaxID=3350177 RepID=UPI00366D0B57